MSGRRHQLQSVKRKKEEKKKTPSKKQKQNNDSLKFMHIAI